MVRDLPDEALVLDLACGTGRLEERLLAMGLHVIAADLSSQMLAVARRKASPTAALRFLRADAADLPLRSCSVDAVIAVRFLHLLNHESRLSVLREMARITKRSVIVEVERELAARGLVPERRAFISRWFSGSVLVVARRSDGMP
jgi:ubiquinone/menaquinone biosynthesis C-methylase UbiE